MTIRIYPFLLALYITIGLPATLNAAEHWVVGSFSVEDNAVAEARRLSAVLNVEVTSHYIDSRGTYRVLVPAGSIDRETLDHLGLSSWRVFLESPASTAATPDTATPSGMTAASTDHEDPAEAPATDSHELAPQTQDMPAAETAYAADSRDSEDDGMAAIAADDNSAVDETMIDGESELEYCRRVPDATLCQHPDFQEMLDKLAELEYQQQALRDRCARPGSAAEQDICDQWLSNDP